ncbi:hypothetical protein A5893_14890 [Pedobacter psychrophilus]|uniref:Uncharacterized protein n=1 Tax=Pedobacter psychrophilus TaxID=1826909 RepID=A0A179DAR9_9SPHI|nr:hypothetical protein [Pedobacter psychrophilus]OAQ38088.1 hypothetical protein A5893_14890 [Pedobacter psychrophilus]
MKERKIKSIEYYRVDGKSEPNKSDEIFKIKIGLYKVENFDTNGNIIKENGFDREMNPDNIIERKFDNNKNPIELLTFKNYYNKPLTKTYLSKYLYENNLLVESLHYYGTFDSSGFWARNKINYNSKKQKIKDEYESYNDDAKKETRIYEWKDEYSYVEDRINKEGILAERHFVRLDKRGKEIQHRINFELLSKEDSSYQVYFEKEFDEYGNEIVSISKYVGKPIQKTEYKYLYDGENWKYRLQFTNQNYWTEFRRIEYY